MMDLKLSMELVELIYGADQLKDESLKNILISCFDMCQEVESNYPDKSVEWKIQVMKDSIERVAGDTMDGHCVAINYLMAVSRKFSNKQDEFAGKVKAELNLPDPMAKVERIPHPKFDSWYHLSYYDPMAKSRLHVGFSLDNVGVYVDTEVGNVVKEIKEIFDDSKKKIANTLHSDCVVNGCQHAKDIGVYPEFQCKGKCYIMD